MAKAKWEKFTKIQIEDIINNSNSNKEVAEKLGYSWNGAAAGGAASALKNMYKKLDLHPTFNLENNLVGQRFGFLTILEYIPAPPNGGKHPYVKCQCDCGTIKNIRLQHLRGRVSGEGVFSRTISCGCKGASSGETLVEAILYEHNIKYQTQYRFEQLYQYPFDFAIFDNNNNLLCVIEYDGQQHFEPCSFFGGESTFKHQQERDELKNKWCKDNNINLIRIPYYEELSWEHLSEKCGLNNIN